MILYKSDNSTLSPLTQSSSVLPSVSDGIPIGYVYIQFPGQSEPSTLWPDFTWTNISSSYAGRFFRAEGGNAASFGNNQGSGAKLSTSGTYSDNFATNHCHPGGEMYVWDANMTQTSAHWSGSVARGILRWGPASSSNSSFIACTSTSYPSVSYNGVSHISTDYNSTYNPETRPTNYTIRIWKRTA